MGGIPRPKRDFFLRKSCNWKWVLGWLLLLLASASFRFLLSHHVLRLFLSGMLCICFEARSRLTAISPSIGLGLRHRGSAIAMHNTLSSWSISSGPHPCSWQICRASATILCRKKKPLINYYKEYKRVERNTWGVGLRRTFQVCLELSLMSLMWTNTQPS